MQKPPSVRNKESAQAAVPAEKQKPSPRKMVPTLSAWKKVIERKSSSNSKDPPLKRPRSGGHASLDHDDTATPAKGDVYAVKPVLRESVVQNTSVREPKTNGNSMKKPILKEPTIKAPVSLESVIEGSKSLKLDVKEPATLEPLRMRTTSEPVQEPIIPEPVDEPNFSVAVEKSIVSEPSIYEPRTQALPISNIHIWEPTSARPADDVSIRVREQGPTACQKSGSSNSKDPKDDVLLRANNAEVDEGDTDDTDHDSSLQFEATFRAGSPVLGERTEVELETNKSIHQAAGCETKSPISPRMNSSSRSPQLNASGKERLSMDAVEQVPNLEKGLSSGTRREVFNLNASIATLIMAPEVGYSSESSSPPRAPDPGTQVNSVLSAPIPWDVNCASDTKSKEVARAPMSPHRQQSPQAAPSVRSPSPELEFEFGSDVNVMPVAGSGESICGITLAIAPPVSLPNSPMYSQGESSLEKKAPPKVFEQGPQAEITLSTPAEWEVSKEPTSVLPLSPSPPGPQDELHNKHQIPVETDHLAAKVKGVFLERKGRDPSSDLEMSKTVSLSTPLPPSPKLECSIAHEPDPVTAERNTRLASKSCEVAQGRAAVDVQFVDVAPTSPESPQSPIYEEPDDEVSPKSAVERDTPASAAPDPTSPQLSQGELAEKSEPEKSASVNRIGVNADRAFTSHSASPQSLRTLSSPRDQSKHREGPSALYSPEGSEFEMPGTSDELLDGVQHSLSMLPLTNVAVHIPAFAEFEPPTPNDMAVVHALEDIILAEEGKRRKDPLAVAYPRRSILVIACSSTRALGFHELLSKRSKMRVVTHGISERFGRGNYRSRRGHFRDSEALDSLFELQDIVITLDATALKDADRGFLNLRRIALIVFDIDFCIYKQNAPSFSERRHPCSILMREHYRALPYNQRPRVLAITSDALKPVELPPIEHNLFCKFISTNVKDEARWKSCYGRGSRPSDMMMDVEQLFYLVESVDDAPLGDTKDRRKSTTKMKRDRRRMSELELLTEEVGPFGVALYQRRFRHRYDGRKLGLRRTHEIVNSNFRIADDTALTGLSQKVLNLLNELQIAYAASTRDSRLMATIYAGRPSTAGAVAEIISAVPVFEGLIVRLAIGGHQGNSFETYGADDDEEKCGIQGDETDEEAVSVFAGGEANILVVAKPYCGALDKDPIAPCPLIFRFDDSVPDPALDGGGGRCRVVDFQESSNRKSDRRIVSVEGKGTTGRQKNESSEIDLVRESALAIQPVHEMEGKPGILEPITQKRMELSCASSDGEDTARIAKHKAQGPPPVQMDLGEDSMNTTVHHRRPPQALLGPDKNKNSQCFLYRILLCEAQISSDEDSSEQEKYFTRIGVEDFLLAFSQMLGEGDKTVALRDISARAGDQSGVAACIKLSYQGPVTFSPEQTCLARRYTAALFSVLSNSIDAKGVFWDEIDNNSFEEPSDKSFRRGYVILPAAESVHEKNVPKNSDMVNMSEQNALFQKYFSPRRKPKSSSWPFYTCSVDWDAVHKLVTVLDSRAKGDCRSHQDNLKPSEWEELEGSFIVSRFTGESAMLCGQMQYDISPLTSFTRHRKFPLNENGTFKDHTDLEYLVNLEASKATIALQSSTTADLDIQNKDVGNPQKPDKDMPSSVESADNKPLHLVRWDPVAKALVADHKEVDKKRKREKAELFDCTRNVKKSRTTWTGRVCYNYEKYYMKYSSSPVVYLDQPLLLAGLPTISSYEQLLRATRGTPISEICQELVTTDRSKEMVRMVIPELCERLPLPVGAIFLPAVLVHLEQHLSLCELRKYFDSRIHVKGNLNTLRQAVTASHVDPANNYERLELLGDSVLKLSCTIRLFTRRPHDSEGSMHTARAFRVSNERLHRLGLKVGIQNYLVFENETEKGYRPPGTDIHGKPVKVSTKALADVVEAGCGAYFLHGVSSPTTPKETSKKKRGTGVAKNGFESSENEMGTGSSDEGEGDKVVRVQEQNGKDLSKNDGVDERPLSSAAVEQGYIAGYKFLEVCGVFEDKEPTHREVLLAAIHAMHPADSPAPREISVQAFPSDRRLSHPKKKWDEEFGGLEEAIGYRFKRRPLLMCALTHASYVKMNGRETAQHQTFQRLEFLGDAVADFCVVRFLYERYPELGPGGLTNLKSNVVSNESFARTAVRWGLHKYLFHGSSAFTKEIESFMRAMQKEREVGKGDFGEQKRTLGEVAAPKVLGDIFEAVVGAVFVDSGLKKAWTVCMRLLGESLRINADPRREDMHPATELQDLVMRVWKLSSREPQYSVVSEKEGTRGKIATVYIGGRAIATGRGTNHKRAKLKAAVCALELLQDEDADSVGGRLLRELREENVARMVAEGRDEG